MKSILKKFLVSPKIPSYKAGLIQGKAYRVLNSHLSQCLLPFDLSVSEWKILGVLSEGSDVTMKELAELLDVEAPYITTMVSRLQKKQLVEKKAHPKDQRVKTATLTGKGKILLDTVEPQVHQTMKQLLSDVSTPDLLAYQRVLHSIIAND